MDNVQNLFTLYYLNKYGTMDNIRKISELIFI
jgi:hypothetical protein